MKVLYPLVLLFAISGCSDSSNDSGSGSESGSMDDPTTAGGTDDDTTGDGADSGTSDGADGDADSDTGDGTNGGTDGETDNGTDDGAAGDTDGETDGETDSGTDDGADGGTDGETDSGTDDDADGTTDGETDSGTDDGADGTTDGETDGGTDDGEMDGDGEPLTALEALQAASTIDADAYTTLIERARTVESAGRFTSENYKSAIAAAAELTRGRAQFSRAEFLTLLERQILADDTPLDFLNITEGSFNRVHLCPDGGRLLASKSDVASLNPLAGSYRFEDCEIGEIFIDGDYSASRRDFSEDRATASISFSGLRIDGVDGITTELGANITQQIQLTDDGTGGQVLTTETTDRSNFSVGIADAGVIDISVFVTTTESATSDDRIDLGTVLPTETRAMRISSNTFAVEDDTNVWQSAVTSTNLAEAPESSNFEQGEMDVTLRPATNRLTVQVANGDEATFDVFILEDDNSVVSFTEDWDAGDYTFGSSQRLQILYDGR